MSEHGSKDRCGATRKVRFKSEAHALNRIKEIRSEGMAAKWLRPYFCQFCGGYHFTKHDHLRRIY